MKSLKDAVSDVRGAASSIYKATPKQGRPLLVLGSIGALLEVSRQILPVPNAWVAGKILRYYGNVPAMNKEFARGIADAADRIGVDPFALTNLMYFESGLNPGAVNRSSGASGLIQFLPSTARSLGTTVEQIRSMSALQQLPLVERYLQGVKAAHGSLREPGDLMLAVFHPAYIGKPNWWPFPSAVVNANPGIVSPWHYERLVTSRSRMPMRAILL
jgi:hypothetical protein